MACNSDACIAQFTLYQQKFADLNISGNDTDLEYYVRECGEILGISQRLPKEQRGSKHILEHVLAQIVEFKKTIMVWSPAYTSTWNNKLVNSDNMIIEQKVYFCCSTFKYNKKGKRIHKKLFAATCSCEGAEGVCVSSTRLLPRDGRLMFQNRNRRDIPNTTLLTRITAHKQS